MSKAYLASGEYAQLVCAYDKNPAKALKKVSKFINGMQKGDSDIMLSGVNVSYDEEGFYHITATVSTVMITL